MGVLISIILGIIPEIIYFSIYVIIVKNLKQKRLLLTILIGISYIICITISRYKLTYYIAFILSIYIILKLLYKNNVQIIDLFAISISAIYVTILSYVLIFFIDKNYSNYYLVLLINRILLYVPFLFYKYFNKIYEYYCELWNRNKNEKRIIKSITLRNISLIGINIFIVSMNVLSILMLSWK